MMHPGSKNPLSEKSANAAKSPRRRGPSRRSERTLKPWLRLGISARTYYRRKRHQQDAHVQTWLQAAGSFVRLDYQAMKRRCELARARP